MRHTIISVLRKDRTFIISALALFVLMLVMENVNGRFWLYDFKVMYSAADALIHGEQVYGIPFGLDTGYYKYSPVTLIFFIPFTLLPYPIASVLDFLMIAMSIIALILLLVRLINANFFQTIKYSQGVLFAILACVIVHLVRELHLGNTNIFLMLLLTLSIYVTLKEKPWTAGALLAIVILTKPYFILVLAPLILHRKFKVVMGTVVAMCGLIAMFFLATGFSKGKMLFTEWVRAMGAHSGYLASNHTISSLLYQYTGITLPLSFSFYLLGGALLLLFIVFWWAMKRKVPSPAYLLVHYFAGVALVPNILITDTEHFLFSTPLITLLVLYLFHKRNPRLTMLFTVIFLLYGGNITDLWGKSLSVSLDQYGLLGVGNLAIVAGAMVVGLKGGSR